MGAPKVDIEKTLVAPKSMTYTIEIVKTSADSRIGVSLYTRGDLRVLQIREGELVKALCIFAAFICVSVSARLCVCESVRL